MVSPAPTITQAPARAGLWQAMIAAAIVAALIAVRVPVAASAPLWLDETWSAMIATRPGWASFWHEARLDVNPPLYYLVLHG